MEDIYFAAGAVVSGLTAGFAAMYIEQELTDYKRRMNELSRWCTIKGDDAIKEIKDYYNCNSLLEKALDLGDTLATRKFLKDRNAF